MHLLARPHVLARLLAGMLLLVMIAALRAHAADFLEPEKAFAFSARARDAKSVEVTFAIAPGYYLYREQFRFAAEGATLGVPVLPPGKVKFDETFQKNVETYRDSLRIVVPVAQAGAAFRLTATSQGCADAGLCYPPMQSVASVNLAGLGGAAAEAIRPASVTSGVEAVLRGGAFWPVVGAFFVAGLLLSLTPCVLPMLPIISSIIVGESGARVDGGVSRRRGFGLALSYSLGMAVVYTAFGVAAGLAGEGLAAALQKPWVLCLFAFGLVALSLSMFGVYELQLPQALSSRVNDAARKLPAGRVLSVCAMGGVSALIVSPCVAAPLAGALLYLSQTRDVWLGGTALFSLAAGMSVPLLVIGASAGALLPRSGAWMAEVKAAFGVLLLGVALWTVQPVLPASAVLALWGVLAVGAATALVARARSTAGSHPFRYAAAAVFGLVGLTQIVGAASGAADPLRPLARLTPSSAPLGEGMSALQFKRVSNVAELDAALRTAGRPVLLDFYADWCVSCKEMERFTFTDARVQQKLAGALLLKADVTANNDEDRALLRRFRLFGPPGTIFFDAQGQELAAARLIGFQKSGAFLETLAAAGL